MKLHYVTAVGQTPPIRPNVLAILLHGGALSSSMYHTLTPHLAMPSVSVDLPGHGQSVGCGPFTFLRSTEQLKVLIDNLRSDEQYKEFKFVLVGISLGGQAVLDFVVRHPSLVSGAIVSGASIHPPDDAAGWEMPHMPTDQVWIDIMTKDVGIIGMEAANAVGQESFGFTFPGRQSDNENFPPLLICVGENDIAMAKRDFEEVVSKAKEMNDMSQGRIIEGAWHNHSIDVPEQFAKLINEWVETNFSS